MTLSVEALASWLPCRGELPKAEGAAQAVYFAMNISNELGITRS